MKPDKISVFEYDRLKVGAEYGGVLFTKALHEALERFHANGNTRYFKLISNGIEFCEYVGVIQVDGLQIEILPKLDRSPGDLATWRDILIGMLREVGFFLVSAPSFGMLNLKANSILELYFQLFITEVEYLVHTGLIKQYRRQALNHTALKGSLDFPRHLVKNLIHKERFYTRSSVYDHDHVWHRILSQCINLIRLLSQNTHIHNRIGALELSFPEVSGQRICDASFRKLVYSRKTEAYRTAIGIARLLLLNFHPELAAGGNSVLALMFDMNLLWESFVYQSLRKECLIHSAPYLVRAQRSADFWSSGLCRRYLRPDIFIENPEDGRRYVLDTKWKDLSGSGPSASDLQQLFAYSQFFRSARNALVYPGRKHCVQGGNYAISAPWAESISCSLIRLGLGSSIRQWQREIYQTVMEWMEVD
ncbi:MAG: hypothetical protein PHX79_03575 [Sphaerochaetaceae bacterium]|jgi:5-methylcytosine-specific restriction enzyme subunit McrC|nr:hypothetical protein [Sphaerochaetaceae bacterium]